MLSYKNWEKFQKGRNKLIFYCNPKDKYQEFKLQMTGKNQMENNIFNLLSVELFEHCMKSKRIKLVLLIGFRNNIKMISVFPNSKNF
jgi:hypothetical protein